MAESQAHLHPHKDRRRVVNRLARIEGHVRAVKEMAGQERDCSDLLLQIAAVRKALDAVAKVILKDHLEQCVLAAPDHAERETLIHDLQHALDHYLR